MSCHCKFWNMADLGFLAVNWWQLLWHFAFLPVSALCKGKKASKQPVVFWWTSRCQQSWETPFVTHILVPGVTVQLQRWLAQSWRVGWGCPEQSLWARHHLLWVLLLSKHSAHESVASQMNEGSTHSFHWVNVLNQQYFANIAKTASKTAPSFGVLDAGQGQNELLCGQAWWRNTSACFSWGYKWLEFPEDGFLLSNYQLLYCCWNARLNISSATWVVAADLLASGGDSERTQCSPRERLKLSLPSLMETGKVINSQRCVQILISWGRWLILALSKHENEIKPKPGAMPVTLAF